MNIEFEITNRITYKDRIVIIWDKSHSCIVAYMKDDGKANYDYIISNSGYVYDLVDYNTFRVHFQNGIFSNGLNNYLFKQFYKYLQGE